jgi:hypothetical protein
MKEREREREREREMGRNTMREEETQRFLNFGSIHRIDNFWWWWNMRDI